MDIGILAILTGIYKLAEKNGLLEHVNKYGEKAFDALYEKLVQDTVFDGLVKKIFKNDVAKKFAAALDKIAPKNETIKRKFLLSLLIDPTINETIINLNRGHLPQQLILTPIFERALGRTNVANELNLFSDLLKQDLKKDQEFTNLVVYSIYEMNQEIVRKITAALGATISTPKKEEKFKISLAKIPTTQTKLFGREDELQRLDDAWNDPHTHILSLVAFGGVGKTALVNEWLCHLDADNYRGAERVYGWSFYSQGTREDRQVSGDEFIAYALKWFGDPDPAQGNPWDKGVRLAGLIRQQRTLLILDGMEPLQYPPGELHGELKDPGVKALLKELAHANPGLCIITTRCQVKDIAHTDGKSSRRIDLEQLSCEAGAELLRHLGVKGTFKELCQASDEFKGHALALNLLGSYLATVHDGEVRQRDLIPHLTEDETQGGHAKRVMASYEIWLTGTPELEILYLMGLFDRPAPAGAIDVLLAEPRITGLTDKLPSLSEAKRKFALKRLRELRLLAQADEHRPDSLDCHPLIREHVSQKLREKAHGAWNMAHGRLYEYYKNLPRKELPDTLEEMEPLFAAVAHGCQADRRQESLVDVFWERIRRKDEQYTYHKLGAFGADQAALSNFFETPWWQTASGLTEEAKAFIFSTAGFGLRALGRLREAAQPMQASIEMLAERKDWKNAAGAAGNLSELYLTLGEVEAAVSSARQSVDFADRSGDGFQKESKRTALADSLHQAGELAQAADLFREAEVMQGKRQPEYRYLYSLQGFQFCDLLLSQGKVREVLERAKQTIEIAIRNNWLLDIALDKLSLGRAYLLEAVNQKPQRSQRPLRFEMAADYLNQAVTGLRESGDQDMLPLALFASAFCYRIQNQFPQAWGDLEEAREIAERGDMKLWLVDYHLEASRLLISEFGFRNMDHQNAPPTTVVETFHETSLREMSPREMSPRETSVHETSLQNAHDHLKQAADLVKKTKYHRRDPDVELGYAGLFLAQGEQDKAREHLGTAKAALDKMGIRMWDFEVRRLEQA